MVHQIRSRHTEMKLEMASHLRPSWMVLEPLFTPRWTCEVQPRCITSDLWSSVEVPELECCTAVLIKPSRKPYQLNLTTFYNLHQFTTCPLVIARSPTSTLFSEHLLPPSHEVHNEVHHEGSLTAWKLKWFELPLWIIVVWHWWWFPFPCPSLSAIPAVLEIPIGETFGDLAQGWKTKTSWRTYQRRKPTWTPKN